MKSMIMYGAFYYAMLETELKNGKLRSRKYVILDSELKRPYK